MSNINSLPSKIDHLIFLCSHISQMATNIRFKHLTNISYTRENIESSYEILLSIAENIEGSIILLESLLPIQQRNLLLDKQTKSKRIYYTREKLLQMRKNVTWKLSNEIEGLLRQVVEQECNDSLQIEEKSWRDIRTILM